MGVALVSFLLAVQPVLFVVVVQAFSSSASWQSAPRAAPVPTTAWTNNHHHGLGKRQQTRTYQQQRYTSTVRTATKLDAASSLKWHVYVDQSKSSLDRGAGATLDAFYSLAPPDQVSVLPALLPSSKKSKGPLVRCCVLDSDTTGDANGKRRLLETAAKAVTDQTGSTSSFDVSNVDSVDKVFRVLTKHMECRNVSRQTCECLQYKYRGNGYLEAGKVALAIDAYDKALTAITKEKTGNLYFDDTRVTPITANEKQEGIILLMRASAYLKRASSHRQALKKIVTELNAKVPETESLQTLYEYAALAPTLSMGIFRRIIADTHQQETKFRQTQYRHGLYQYALLQASQDALRATQLLPDYAESWRQAAEILSELWKLKESAQYYVRAVELDPLLTETLTPLIEQLRKRQELLDNARAFAWSEDTLRLALDVAR